MREFRKQLDALGRTNHQHYLLTMFGPAGEQNFSNIELAKVGRTLDFYNVQGYDFHGTWETSTNHASPLFDSTQDPARADNFYLDYTVNGFLKAGVPARKLVLGIPLYGRGWTGVPNINHGLYQTSTAPAPFDPADYLQTPGVETYLSALHRHQQWIQELLRPQENCRLALQRRDPNLLELRRPEDGPVEDDLHQRAAA